jgi:hypothetical protein
MNIVIISTGKRKDLLWQTISSLVDNADVWENHTLTLVGDGDPLYPEMFTIGSTVIHNTKAQGASAARNIGAGSIPKYRRQDLVMFADDDCFFLKHWDRVIQEIADRLDRTIMSPYGHPFNIEEPREAVDFARFPLLISSVAMVMRWTSFDEIGYWQEPGGPSGSEDFEFCSRARNLGYDFAVSNPHMVIHTGLVNSRGERIVGYDQLKEQNDRLIEANGLQGKVVFNE